MTGKRPSPYMSAAEYCAALRGLGLSKRGARVVLHCEQRSSFRWASGEQPVPAWVAMLLRTMLRYGLDPQAVAALARDDEAAKNP